jgi:hypothetical protein
MAKHMGLRCWGARARAAALMLSDLRALMASQILCFGAVVRTPEAVAQVHAELPKGFSQQVADKVLGGLLSAARALKGMPTT